MKEPKWGLELANFYKKNAQDIIWWTYPIGYRLVELFSFDMQTVYYFFEDYVKLTDEQKAIFDRENPEKAQMVHELYDPHVSMEPDYDLQEYTYEPYDEVG